ncbi:hypothetical protein [Chondromyces apiculatus]|uniref:Uncharacterized protein n=1 Tax=Chondromyces apiculatus DSM 436 TaxID=1192034 RepID=A0A017T705_9BACT|nr:hypothetical protein [Chondromyces apiculatus]EYF04550.1 Hypothetical protein CAP_4370 [Chondromyces apiculatus DSM 436]
MVIRARVPGASCGLQIGGDKPSILWILESGANGSERPSASAVSASPAAASTPPSPHRRRVSCKPQRVRSGELERRTYHGSDPDPDAKPRM